MKPRFIPCRVNGKVSDVLVKLEGDQVKIYSHVNPTLTAQEATNLAVALNAAATEIRFPPITPLLDAIVEKIEVTQEQITSWAGPRTGTHPLAGDSSS